jgi:hypothetical protein
MKSARIRGYGSARYVIEIDQNVCVPKAPTESLESIAKAPSICYDDEKLWLALQYYTDRAHGDQVHSKIIQDENIDVLMKGFIGLLAKGSSVSIGAFNRLGV